VENQFVALKLGNEEYAVDILAVQEIIRCVKITRVPKAPFFVQGIINLRGNVIPVINSHLRMGVPETDTTNSSRIIVFRQDDIVIGFNVDQVVEVLTLSEDQIEKPQSLDVVNNQFIKGIGKIDNRLIIILDLNKILDIGI
jgi:purine-binding chemotaxis protein CheW